jgi:hypothetical protein
VSLRAARGTPQYKSKRKTGIAIYQRWLALLRCSLQRSLFETAQAACGREAQLGSQLVAACIDES